MSSKRKLFLIIKLLFPVLIVFVAFAIHFYHSLVVHKYESSTEDIEQLESMKRNLDSATITANSPVWEDRKTKRLCRSTRKYQNILLSLPFCDIFSNFFVFYYWIIKKYISMWFQLNNILGITL